MQIGNRMAGIFFTILSLLGLATGLEVLFPAGGNVWDLDQVNSYKVFWRSASADPTHVHVALHDAAGNVVDSYESVKTSSGSYLISGLSGIPSGSNYRIVLSDSATPKRKVVARSGKFSIRQVADTASSGLSQDVAPTSSQPQSATIETVTTSIQPPSSPTEAVPTRLASVVYLSSTPTSTSSSLQTPSQGIPTASTTFPPFTSSSRTSISTQTSTGFPKFVIPAQKGLSKGAKIGIGVGVAILLLISLGVCIFFWRRRRRQQRESRYWNKALPGMSTLATPDGHHGKPELVGDQASLIYRDPGVRYVQKPELETRSSITNCSESNDQRNEVQPVPFGVAELTQRACMQGVPVGVVELPQRSPGHHAPVHGRIAAEIDSSTPRHPHHRGDENAQTGPSDGTEDGVYQYQYQHQHQGAVELPARNPTRNARNSNSNSNSIPSRQPSRPAPQLSPQQELLPTAPTTLPPPSSSSLLRSPRSVAPATAAPSTPLPPLPPPQDKTTKHDDDDDLATLRRRERTIAESISAAEALERLRREQLEVQERIRIAEASRGATNGG